MTSKEIKDNFGNTKQLCCACNKEKPMSEFYRNIALKSGYMSKCKKCKITGISCRKKKEKKIIKRKSEGLFMFNTTKEDWIEMFQFLQKIGYSLETPIHEQFCLKYNLTPRKLPKRDKTIKYTPKELGLI